MKYRLLALIIGVSALSNIAYADASYQLNFNRYSGHFTCTANVPNNTAVYIDTSGVKVKGPNCDGHGISTTSDNLNHLAYYWKRDRLRDAHVIVTVYGNVTSLTCQDDQQGKPEAMGGDCLSPIK